MKALEIGPGEHPLPGFDTLDMCQRLGTTYVAHWGKESIPAPDATYDFIFASHVLEHVPWHCTEDALREAQRILKPGGVLEIWVPNFAYIIECYAKRICGDSWRRENPHANPMRWVNGRIFTYGPGEENWHRACFDAAYLHECLACTGFVQIAQLNERTRGVSHGPIDLGMTGRKP